MRYTEARWGHLRLEIETKGEFLEPERHVITDEDFIGSSVQINYLVHADQLKRENHIGEIIVRSPYQELTYHVLASRGARIHIDVHREEKRHKLALVKDYLEYQENRINFQTWKENAGFELNQLREAGCEYPEYSVSGGTYWHIWTEKMMWQKKSSRIFTVKNLQEKNWKQPELISISVQ